MYDKGSLTLEATFLPKPYSFEVSVVQAAILKLFDNKDTITVKEVIDTLGIDQKTVKACLGKSS